MKTSRFFRPLTVVLLLVILLLAVPFTEANSPMTVSPTSTARGSLADALRRDVTLENCDPAYAPDACVVDQRMIGFNGRQVLGGNTVLSQTFRPTVNKRVCKVNVRINKLVNRPTPAGDLILSVRTMGGVILDNAVRPANLIPMGVSVQSFDLGCNGGVLVAGNLWILAAVMFVAGIATAPTLITTMNLIERIVPRAQLNEGMTIVLTGLIIGIAVGSAVSGAVIDRVGARHGYWVAIVAAAAAFLMALGTRALLSRREMANLR